ncbi:MAG: precorrin-3B C(17)-methyltransferase, partial [Rhizobiales bacterium]|nr:precorrin-3B C(17)-methyltransferase [Hyphomicrobiales bacterium]
LNVADSASLEVVVSEQAVAGAPDRLVVQPKPLAIGIGAERGAEPGDAAGLVREVLDEAGFAPQSVAVLASLDLKEDESALLFISETYSWPARFFDAGRLEAETPRLINPSDMVYQAVGCHGVAEAAALAAVGAEGELVVAKRIGRRVTCALARAPVPIEAENAGRGRASLAIVGLGPGGRQWRSNEADELIGQASDIVGYGLYLDLAGPLRRGQRAHDFALGEEAARVAHALDLAAEGRRVALISSGDAGIYGMAALAFEMIETGPAHWRRVEVTVAPGISALQAAAARAGAPLGHDFCAISLSDLMTPAAVIERRIVAAAQGDFVIALYNPASKRRRQLLSRAIEILRQHRSAATPLVIARALGRPGETVDIMRLDQFDADAVDMLSLVLVGSSTTRSFERGNGATSVYTPRGYTLGQSDTGLSKVAP